MDQNKDIFMLRAKEIKRYQVIRKILDHEINQQEASEYLRITDRQVRRIVKRVRLYAEQGVIHQSRGQVGNRKKPAGFKRKVLELYQKSYWDFGPTLASEKLLERDGVKVCDETLRLWLIKEGLWQYKKRKDPKERSRRTRKEHFGQMVQMDGSHHDWLEGRGPKLVLMGYIDDATNELYGQFHDYEGTMPAMGGLKGYIKRYGLPASIYLDRHSTYKNNRRYRYTDWPFRDQDELTQFGRACHQLGIELIFAHSPQAKGRVERVFRTLQDRLTKELRLAQARSLDEANDLLRAYLPVFNGKFGIQAVKSTDVHRQPDKRVDLDGILSVQTQRFLRNDRTVQHNKRWYQVTARTRAKWITVFEYLDGSVVIKYGSQVLPYDLIQEPSLRPRVSLSRKIAPRFKQPVPRNSGFRMFRLPGSPTFRN